MPTQLKPLSNLRLKLSLPGKLYIVLMIAALAVFLRIYAISLYPLSGDEYGSLAEAKSVGLNWNSIVYSALMHYWIRFGTSEFWLRLPAAIFGVIAVGILYRVGETLGGWRTGAVAAFLAATSPFNIYHSQEVRFYSLFMCASAAFMLATICYVDSRKTLGNRGFVFISGLVLVFSHFLGVLALYAQSAATVVGTKTRWSKRTMMLGVLTLTIILFGLPLIPGVQRTLVQLYRTYGNSIDPSMPVTTPLSLLNLAKAAFAGYVFIFGYHVYPLRFVFVITGVFLSALLLVTGIIRLWKHSEWGVLPFTYLLVFLGVYIVLDSAGGRVASGVGPRHVAFAWPVLLLLTAIGLSSFRKPAFHILLAGVVTINILSLWSRWTKEWTYGNDTDYRSAADYASRWVTRDTAIIHDGRSEDPISFYFPKGVPLISSWGYLQGRNLDDLNGYQRLVFVTDDWEAHRREAFDQFIERLSGTFTCVDGRVDYPLFEYVFERKTPSEKFGYGSRSETKQVLQPLSIYGLEFQDLQLPVAVKVKDVPFLVIGAYSVPDLHGQRKYSIPLADPPHASRIVLLSNVVGALLDAGQQIAEVTVEDNTGSVQTLPLRLGVETASWDTQCSSTAPCQTVYRWHKRMAIVGQNSYQGALRDFQAGLHGVVLDLPEQEDVAKLTIRYMATSGHLYVWAIALLNDQGVS